MSELPVVLVTGASRGLGAAVALEAARRGLPLVLNARDGTRLAQVAARCRGMGSAVHIVVGDIGQPETAARLVETAVHHFGTVHSVINNAGVLQPIARVAQADAAAWEANWRTNLLGPVLLSAAALPYLRRTRGRIVNVSTGAAVRPVPTWGAYATAKAGLNHLTRILAVEEPEVTTVAFRPGIVDTDMQAVIREHGAGVMPPEEHARFVAYHREGRLRPPEEIARLLLALALHAPPEWSGEFIAFDDPRLHALVDAHGMAGPARRASS